MPPAPTEPNYPQPRSTPRPTAQPSRPQPVVKPSNDPPTAKTSPAEAKPGQTKAADPAERNREAVAETAEDPAGAGADAS